jgi:hypothetical protein
LPEEFAFFLLLEGTALALFPGLLALGSWEATMDGAAIFELDLALLDLGFLDLEFGRAFVVIMVARLPARNRGLTPACAAQ